MTNTSVLREAPLDYTYGYTINVSPTKILSGRYNRKRYGELSSDEQKAVIGNVITDYFDRLRIDTEDVTTYEYEKTKAGIIHVHGVIKCTESQVSHFQEYIHRKLGMPRLIPSICCYYEKTIVDPKYWHKYMTKEKELNDESPTYDTFMF